MRGQERKSVSSIRESSQYVGDASDLLVIEGEDGAVFRQDGVSRLDALPSCSNDETSGQSLSCHGGELLCMGGAVGNSDGVNDCQLESEFGKIISDLEGGVREIECVLGISIGGDYDNDVLAIRGAICVLKDLDHRLEVAFTGHSESNLAGSMSVIFDVDRAIALLKEGLDLIKAVVDDFVAASYFNIDSQLEAKVRGFFLKKTSELLFVNKIVRIEGDLRVFRVQKEQMFLSSRKGVGVDPEGKSNLDEIVGSVVGSCGGNAEFRSALKALIGGVLVRVTNCNGGGVDGFGGDHALEELIIIILRVASSIAIGIDEGCDFLLKSSDKLKGYLVSKLGMDAAEVVGVLLNDDVSVDVLGLSGGELKGNAPELVCGLLEKLGCLVESVAAARIVCYDSLGNSLFRSCASSGYVADFLRKIISLLVFFPEALHPGVVWSFDKRLFNYRFTPEGRCNWRHGGGGGAAV